MFRVEKTIEEIDALTEKQQFVEGLMHAVLLNDSLYLSDSKNPKNVFQESISRLGFNLHGSLLALSVLLVERDLELPPIIPLV